MRLKFSKGYFIFVRASTIFARRFPSNSRITCSKIENCRWKGNFENYSLRCRGRHGKGTGLPLPCLCRAELPTLHPVSDVITVHLVHLMHPVGSCLGVCLSRTAKSLHSIFHIAERFCLPTGTTRSAVICIYLCSNSKQCTSLVRDESAYFSLLLRR